MGVSHALRGGPIRPTTPQRTPHEETSPPWPRRPGRRRPAGRGRPPQPPADGRSRRPPGSQHQRQQRHRRRRRRPRRVLRLRHRFGGRHRQLEGALLQPAGQAHRRAGTGPGQWPRRAHPQGQAGRERPGSGQSGLAAGRPGGRLPGRAPAPGAVPAGRRRGGRHPGQPRRLLRQRAQHRVPGRRRPRPAAHGRAPALSRAAASRPPAPVPRSALARRPWRPRPAASPSRRAACPSAR